VPNEIPLEYSLLLPVGTVNHVETLKVVIEAEARKEQVALTRSELDHAMSIVLSRGFEVEINGDPHIFLLPEADLLNHHVNVSGRSRGGWGGGGRRRG
jgi:hypothetical protein